jgi:hypothetical protein
MMSAWPIQEPGRWQGRKVSAFLAVLITCHGVSVAQQKKTTCLCDVKYENYNFIEPEALTVCDLKGQVTNQKSAHIPQACLGVYTEAERKLIASTTSDENGNYKFDKIRPGQYRLIVFSNGYCTANAKIIIASTCLSSIKYKSVYVHMRVREIDTCSYANHTRPRIENGL